MHAPACQPSPAALHLLAEVLARVSTVARPIVHVVAAGGQAKPAGMALDFAAAAATSYGRTLLVSSNGGAAAEAPGTRGLSWLMADFSGQPPDGLTPDTLVPGLYYASLNLARPGPPEPPVAEWLAAPQAFRMIIIESPSISADPRTLATVAHGHGVVLAVAAGQTTLAEIRTASRQLAAAGIVLLGTVLHGAPTIGFGPRRRRAA